jgi:hypothetical protein
MNLDLTITLPISREEERQLAGILECKASELTVHLAPVAASALQEYVRMFLGQKVFTRGADILEYRLFLLIKELFDNAIPDEQRVCDLFQATSGQARSLIRSVLSKYQYELHDAMSATLVATLQQAAQPEEDADYEVTVNTQSLVDGLNRLLANADGTLPPIMKKRGTVATFIIRPSAFAALASALHVA